MKRLLWMLIISGLCLDYSAARYTECVDDEYFMVYARFEEDGENYYIVSPRYPDSYKRETECGVKFQAPNDDSIVVVDVEMVMLSNCKTDDIKFYDGRDDDARVLGSTCSNSVRFKSSGRYLYLEFEAEDVFDDGVYGFRIRYHAEPNDAPEATSSSAVTLSIVCVAVFILVVLGISLVLCFRWHGVNRANRSSCFYGYCLSADKTRRTTTSQSMELSTVHRLVQGRALAYQQNSTPSINGVVNQVMADVNAPPPSYVYYNPAGESSSDLPPSYEDAVRELKQAQCSPEAVSSDK